MTLSTKVHAKLLAAAVACAQAKAAMDACDVRHPDRNKLGDEVRKKTWALRSAAVAFSKTAKGRQIAAELNGPSKDTRS